MTASVTGIGLVTPIGGNVAEVFDALCTGRSGLRRPPPGHPVAGRVEVAGIGPDIDPALVLSGPDAVMVDRYILMALLAADRALADAGITVGRDVDPERTAVIVSAVGGLGMFESQVAQRTERQTRITPYLLPGVLPNMGAARIAIAHGIRGYSSSVSTACASGGQSIGEAVRLLRTGEADVVLCGCSEAPLFPTMVETFGNARALAHGWDDPAAASRPFDVRRNGMVLAEGAAVLVLERTAHADARGAAGYADVAGWAVTTDAYHPTMPRPDGTSAAECMRRALADAGLAAGDIGYLNVHGTGTKLGDRAEATGIRTVFGDGGPPLSATKAVTGHMLGASGAVEAAVTALSLRRGELPPTHNLDDPDPACELDHIRKRPRTATIEHAMSTSFGFGGHNVTLVLSQPGTRQKRPAQA